MEDAKKSNPKKWEAKVSTTLSKATPDQIFPLFKDFFNLHKWFPGLPTCYGIHGDNGELGCIRYFAGSGIPSVGDDQEEVKISWSRERLTAVDPIGKGLSYDIVDCNIGFKSYVSTVQISPGGDGTGCLIEWSISFDPVEGWRFEDLVMRFQVKLNGMVRKMEDELFTS